MLPSGGAVLVTASRYPPGDLPGPEHAGLVAAKVCRLSGLLASPECPGITEYFTPGTVPEKTCDWHLGGEVRLPVEYAEWEAVESQRLGGSTAGQLGLSSAPEPTRGQRDESIRASATRRTPEPPSRLEITSPQQNDHYQIPPGVEARYASVALRAVGSTRDARVRWFVDDHRVATSRWVLVAGRHEIRAEAGHDRAAVTITVDAP